MQAVAPRGRPGTSASVKLRAATAALEPRLSTATAAVLPGSGFAQSSMAAAAGGGVGAGAGLALLVTHVVAPPLAVCESRPLPLSYAHTAPASHAPTRSCSGENCASAPPGPTHARSRALLARRERSVPSAAERSNSMLLPQPPPPPPPPPCAVCALAPLSRMRSFRHCWMLKQPPPPPPSFSQIEPLKRSPSDHACSLAPATHGASDGQGQLGYAAPPPPPPAPPPAPAAAAGTSARTKSPALPPSGA